MTEKKKSNRKNKKVKRAAARSKAKKSNHKDKKKQTRPGLLEELFSVATFMLAVFLFVSISRFQGLPEDTQFIGLLGQYLIIGLQTACGDGAIFIPFFFLAWAIHTGISKKMWSLRMWGVTLLLLTVLTGISAYNIPVGMNPWEAGMRSMGGGYIGGALAYFLIKFVGDLGIIIIIVLNILLSVVLLFQRPIAEVFAPVWALIKKVPDQVGTWIDYEEASKPLAAGMDQPVKKELKINPSSEQSSSSELLTDKVKLINPLQEAEEREKNAVVNDTTPLPISNKKLQTGDSNYKYPPLELLKEVSSVRTVDKKQIKNSIDILEDTFASFGIGVQVNEVSCGPAVTRYELTPAPGVKVSKIISLTDDLQLNLAAPGIRMEAPIPGKSAIGIEVPNNKVRSVGLRNLLASANFKNLNSPLAIALGEDIAGNSVVTNLSEMPHLLIAGSTGSGKSVCLNSIIMSLIFHAHPDELKLVFIDPKMVELTVYNGIPHLMTPVVTDPKKAAIILRWMTNEMEKRYKIFAEKGVRDIYRYNKVSNDPMPFIVIIIDELADLMMVSPVEVEDSICRLAQMARAAGMHLIVATQRPSVDVVTGIIKANIPSRIAFAVSSQADSRTILDIVGAEKLLGKGDMLFFPVGAVKPSRVQGAYVSDAEIEATVEFLKQDMPDLKEEQAEQLKKIEQSIAGLEEEDELFWDAVRILVESQKASISYLQRRLRIGYSRAARLVDVMEERGIVSEPDHNKRREILITEEELQQLNINNKL
ncbi:MAG TPA: DNA translocase FtsK [Syntrophomonadaceae bacterium]|nr:DNA translocase FtsK [Syntrophomonadaceae bacterium]